MHKRIPSKKATSTVPGLPPARVLVDTPKAAPSPPQTSSKGPNGSVSPFTELALMQREAAEKKLAKQAEKAAVKAASPANQDDGKTASSSSLGDADRAVMLDEELINSVSLKSAEQAELDEDNLALRRIKEEAEAIKASLKESKRVEGENGDNLAQVRKMLEQNKMELAEMSAKARDVKAQVAGVTARREELQASTSALDKKRLDLIASPPKAAASSDGDFVRPGATSAEGRQLVRLERLLESKKEELAAKRSRFEHVTEENADFKGMIQQRKSDQEKLQSSRAQLHAELKDIEEQKAHASSGAKAKLEAKIADGKGIEAENKSLQDSIKDVKANLQHIEKSIKQLQSIPTSDGQLASQYADLQIKKSTAAQELAKAEANIKELKEKLDAVKADCDEFREETARQEQAEQAEAEKARALHPERQKRAYERLAEIIPAARSAQQVYAARDGSFTVLADTVASVKYIKVDKPIAAELFGILEAGAAKKSETTPEEDQLLEERSKLKALEVRLASLRAKAALGGRAEPALSLTRSRRGSDASRMSQLTEVPSEVYGDLQTRYSKVDRIGNILQARYRALVNIQGDLQRDMAELDLMLCD